jgi:hypothetical protein
MVGFVSRIDDGGKAIGGWGEETEREAYRSMFSDSNWVLEPAFLARRLLRRLAGILELPGIVNNLKNECSEVRCEIREV